MFTSLGSLQSRRDACKQFLGITWLGEVADDAISHRTNPNTLVWVCSDQNRWNGVARFDQTAVQFDSKAPRTIAGFGDSALAERTSAGLVPR
jgi:hypothetical protein